ncbi:MAG: AAA family ATPase [Bacteroidales bacterium]|nr:AAA family ATPase [Bacteroidales bacterium]MBN2758081.1 AAA family ATPase [Bacteroidales bacterium]
MDKIYLIGFMGSGKTSVGKKLARKLEYDFIDLDSEIQKYVNQSVSEYFDKYGEERFRIIEQKILRDTFRLSKTVIATGGGTPCFFDNINEINENGFSIYLKADSKTLINRLLNAKEERPLLKNKKSEDLEIYIDNLLSERESFYLQANLIAEAKDINLDTILDRIRF